MLRLSPLFS